MRVSAERLLDVPVSLTLLGEAPVVGTARLVRLEREGFDLERLDLPVSPGASLVIALDERTWVSGRVERVDPAGAVHARRTGTRTSEDRSSPRVPLEVSVRFRALPPDRRTDPAWLAGGVDPGPFQVQRGPVELSGSGMLLPCAPADAPVGSRLLVELDLAGVSVRAVGCVRRHRHGAAAPAVGLEFVELAEESSDELSLHLLRHLLPGRVG